MSDLNVLSHLEVPVGAGHGLPVGETFYVPIGLVDTTTGIEIEGRHVVQVTVVEEGLNE